MPPNINILTPVSKTQYLKPKRLKPLMPKSLKKQIVATIRFNSTEQTKSTGKELDPYAELEQDLMVSER